MRACCNQPQVDRSQVASLVHQIRTVAEFDFAEQDTDALLLLLREVEAGKGVPKGRLDYVEVTRRALFYPRHGLWDSRVPPGFTQALERLSTRSDAFA